MKKLMIFAVVPLGVLTLWGTSDAATPDTAAASVDKSVAQVGEPITFTSTNACTTACSLTWRRPDIGLIRFGGVIVGRGEQLTLSFANPGSYEVVLDMGETCDGTTQLVCHSYADVFVDVVAAPVDPPPVDPAPVDPVPPVVDPVPPALVAPSDLSVTMMNGRPRLTWTNPASSTTSVIVERCRGAGCTSFLPIASLTPTTTSFVESRIKGGSSDLTYRLVVSDSIDTVYSNLAVANPSN